MIIPVAKTLYLCDDYIGYPQGKTDLVSIFNTVHPQQYPHVQKHFVVFAQLIAGLGSVPFYIDVRFAPTGKLVHTTNTHFLNFPHRDKLVQLAYTMKNCPFYKPGVYLVELYCDAKWVADTTVMLS